jgi:hypothetical protein
MPDIIETLLERADSYDQGGPSSAHTSKLLREAAWEIETLRANALRARSEIVNAVSGIAQERDEMIVLNHLQNASDAVWLTPGHDVGVLSAPVAFAVSDPMNGAMFFETPGPARECAAAAGVQVHELYAMRAYKP